MNKLLLIEDDPSLGYILKEYLQMHDFSVEWAQDGEAGLAAFHQGTFDLCILDIMMPKKDGFAVAEEIKGTQPQLPLIFLTAKALKIDKLKGFKLGADDYLVKPVDEEELIARIHAVLRRSGGAPLSMSETFALGSFTFHTQNQTLTWQGHTQHLTPKESKVLEMLCAGHGDLVARDAMLKALWGESNYFKRRSMDVFISKLRKYLEADPTVKIVNVHGRGYLLEC